MNRLSNKGIKQGKLGAPSNKEKHDHEKSHLQSIVMEIIQTGVYFYTHTPSNVHQAHKTTSRVAYVNDIRQPTERSPFLKKEKLDRQTLLKCKECDTNLYNAYNFRLFYHLINCYPSANIRSFSLLDKRSQDKYGLPKSKNYIGARAFPSDQEINLILKRISDLDQSERRLFYRYMAKKCQDIFFSNKTSDGTVELAVDATRLAWPHRDLINCFLDLIKAKSEKKARKTTKDGGPGKEDEPENEDELLEKDIENLEPESVYAEPISFNSSELEPFDTVKISSDKFNVSSAKQPISKTTFDIDGNLELLFYTISPRCKVCGLILIRGECPACLYMAKDTDEVVRRKIVDGTGAEVYLNYKRFIVEDLTLQTFISHPNKELDTSTLMNGLNLLESDGIAVIDVALSSLRPLTYEKAMERHMLQRIPRSHEEATQECQLPRMLLIPLLGNGHYVLFVYHVESNTINAYNSLKRFNTGKETGVCEILQKHFRLKKLPSILYAEIKQQQNNDCGFHVLMHAYFATIQEVGHKLIYQTQHIRPIIVDFLRQKAPNVIRRCIIEDNNDF